MYYITIKKEERRKKIEISPYENVSSGQVRVLNWTGSCAELDRLVKKVEDMAKEVQINMAKEEQTDMAKEVQINMAKEVQTDMVK